MMITPLELALVILVSVWTLIFIVFGIVGYRLLLQIHAMLEKVHAILDSTRSVTEDVRAPFQAAAAGVKEIFAGTSSAACVVEHQPADSPLGEPLLEPVP